MNAKELKLGNILKINYSDKYKDSFIAKIIISDIERIEIENFKTYNYEPVLLTDKTWDKICAKNDIYQYIDCFVVLVGESLRYTFDYEDYEYIHKLQNLYFALKNIPLVIDL